MKRHLRFTKKETPSVTQMPKQQSKTDTTLPNFYRSIYNLPLRKFEECLLDKNLSVLTISGFPTPEELNNAWNNIVQEYSDNIGSTEHKIYLHLFKEVEILKLDYSAVGLLIASLRKVHVPYFCDELNGLLHTNCRFNINDLASYYAELDKCERRSKAMKIRLDLKTIEFESVKKKMSGEYGKIIDKNYFTSVLIILSKHNNYRITKDITVSEYCEYMKQFNIYCEQVRDQIKKK